MKIHYLKTSLVIFFTYMLLLGNAQANDSFGFIEGIHYKKLPKQLSIAPHTKQVTKIFYYGCPHCFSFEPSAYKWLETKPADVNFERLPAVLNNPNWVFMARVYYTAVALGIEKQFHMPYFNAMHRDKKSIFDIESLAKFVEPMGIDSKTYKKMFKSFKVDQMVQKAKLRTSQYNISGVPAIVINGKYLTDTTLAGSREKVWELVDILVNRPLN